MFSRSIPMSYGKVLLALPFSLLIIVAAPAFGQETQAARPSASGGFDGPAELPRVHVKSSLADTPAPGQVRLVRAGDSLEAAINAANCGDTLQLQAGATFHGKFRFPGKPCDDAHWIIIRTSAPDSDLPSEGTRLTPCYAGISSLPARPDFHCRSTHNVMAKIELDEGSESGPIVLLGGANHYRFLGLEITRGTPGANLSALVFVTGGTANHLIFDRVWLHGTAQDETTRGIWMNDMSEVAVVDSFFTDFHCVAVTGSCTDAQALAASGSNVRSGPYKIENNFLEASGENIMFGGGTAALAPTDIEIRHNHLYKPIIWKPNQPGFVGAPSGRPFIVKNHFELKNAQRVLFEDNLLENAWGGFSQAGFSVLLGPKNQGNHCPLCIVTDVTIRYCEIKNVGGGFVIANVRSDAGGESSGGWRYSIHDVLVYDVHENDLGSFGIFAMVASFAPPLRDVHIEHVTAFIPNVAFSFQSGPKIANFVVNNNIFVLGTNRQIGSLGGGSSNCAYQPDLEGPANVFKNCFQNYTLTHNLIVGGSDWGSGNMTPGNLKSAGIREVREPGSAPYTLCREKDSNECKKASRALNAATDGRDIGADVEGIRKALKGVI